MIKALTKRFYIHTSKLSIACALASPMISHAIEMPNLPCKSNSYADLQRVALYTKGKDNRKSLDKAGASLGLSEAEMQRIRVNTGKIVCPGTGKYEFEASASLVGDGTHLITNAHEFMDEKTKKFYEPLSKCYFENKDTPPSKSFLAIQSDHSGLKMGAGYPQFDNADYAIAKLATPIANANPFPVNLNKRNKLLSGDHTVVVTNSFPPAPNLDPKQPAVQSCEPHIPEFGNPDAFYSKCDALRGASGSAHLYRNPNGELVLRAMVARCYVKTDRVDYDPSKNNGTYSIEIDGEFLDDILKEDPSIRPHHGGVY